MDAKKTLNTDIATTGNMNILINFTDNPESLGGVDHRPQIILDMAKYLKQAGHKIYIDLHKYKNKKYRAILRDNEFRRYRPSWAWHNKHPIDFWLACFPHSAGHDPGRIKDPTSRNVRRHVSFQGHKVKIAVYEHAWLHKSILVDRHKLFSDSYYTDKIDNLIDSDYNEKSCSEYRRFLLEKNLSKRVQNTHDDIPDIIKSQYIFVPVQKIKDVSLRGYSPIGMLSFMSEVVRFAKSHHIPVVFKLHPHTPEDYPTINKYIGRLRKSYKHIYNINAPIYELMTHALFTACINAGTMVDNFITQTPVCCCGRSMFYQSGAIVYRKNVNKGLIIMLKKNYDGDLMREKQSRMLWWLKQNLLFADLSPKENVRRMEKHVGINLIPS